jgi:hypothetical protein
MKSKSCGIHYYKQRNYEKNRKQPQSNGGERAVYVYKVIVKVDIFVNIFHSGNLIDTRQWQLRAWVPNCAAYLPEFDCFVTSGKDPDTGLGRFGLYNRYSLEQIKDMAREALGIFELTNEQKEQYGIS